MLGLFLLCVRVGLSLQGKSEKRLFEELLVKRQYSPWVRPVLNETDPIVVTLGLDLQQVIDIDEKNQVVQSNVWLRFEWTDQFMSWEPEKFGGIAELRISADRVWKPDILLYNSADVNFDGTLHTNVVAHSTGRMVWIPPGIVKSTCKIDITWFPFDDQRCGLKFGSWTHSGFQIELHQGVVELATYTENGEWLLMGAPAERHSVKYDCCPEPYYDVTFTLWLRRRTMYYGFNLIIPCVLISTMTLLSFTLPPDSGEKLTLGVTIFMSLCVFLLMVAESMPPTSETVPLIATYFSSIMIIVSISVAFTVLVLNLHHRSSSTHEMTGVIRLLLLHWLPWLLLMKRPGHSFHRASVRCASQQYHQRCRRSSQTAPKPDVDTLSLPVNGCLHNTHRQRPLPPPVVELTSSADSQLAEMLAAILKELQLISARIRKQDNSHRINEDWKFAAMVVDRLCLIMFSLFMLICTCAILLSAPHLVT